MAEPGRFKWPDYVVFALGLLISASIGVYYAIQRRRNTKAGVSEYLMGSRNVGIVPVAASMVVSLVSAVSVLGFAAEVYSFGAQIFLYILGYAVALVIAGIFYLPVYHKLKLTSMYEYLEMRFDRTIRSICSGLNMVALMLYSSIALYAPSLAISQVTGMSYWSCILLSSILSTFYTVLGGFKSVLWTDTIQACIMVIGLLATVVKGAVDAGGTTRIIEMNKLGGRLDINKVVPDLFSRYNVWGWLFGDMPFMLSLYATSQLAVQRFCSVGSVNKARVALMLGFPVYSVILAFSMSSGLVAFAYFYGCDPLVSGRMDRSDQILPALVMDVYRNHAGMPGLFLSSVLCAALSTLSSVQHSMAAMLLQDGLKPLKLKLTGKPFTERQGTVLSQLIVLLVGATIMGLALGVAGMGKTILRLAFATLSLSYGPSLGLYTAGMYVSFANSWGALIGMLVSVVMLVWINVGAVMHKGAAAIPLPVFNHLCTTDNTTLINTTNTLLHSSYNLVQNITMTTTTMMPTPSSGLLKLYQFNYRYHVFLAAVITVVVCLLVSLLTGGWKQRHWVAENVLFSWKEHGLHASWSAKENQSLDHGNKEQEKEMKLFNNEVTQQIRDDEIVNNHTSIEK